VRESPFWIALSQLSAASQVIGVLYTRNGLFKLARTGNTAPDAVVVARYRQYVDEPIKSLEQSSQGDALAKQCEHDSAQA